MNKWISTCCRIIVLSAMFCLSSCTVQSNQFSALTSLAKQPQDALAAYRWRVEFGGYQADVFAVTTADGTLFTNNDEDIIVFDGWTITEVQGLGLTSSISVEGRTGERVGRQNSRLVNTQSCEDWQKVMQGKSATYEQNCMGIGRYQNRITLGSDGAIVRIMQHFGFKELGSNTAITLIKL